MHSKYLSAYLAATALLFTAPSYAVTIPGQTLYGPVFWTSAMNPIVITGDITIDSAATLNIGPGCDVRFQENYDDTRWGWDITRSEIIVYGTLNINGTAVNLVTLTSTGTGDMGWFGIIFSDNTATGTIDYCNIDRSVYGINFTACDGPLYGGTAPVVTNCTINDVYTGIYFDDDSSPSISDTTVIHASIAFSCWSSSSPAITDCNAANLSDDAMALYATEGAMPTLIGCAFSSGSADLDLYSYAYIQDTSITNTKKGLVGHETYNFGPASILSYCRAEIDNCNIIGLGGDGQGITWDDNLDICKVQYSRIGGFKSNVWPRYGEIKPPDIPHALGIRFGGAYPNNIDLGDLNFPDPLRSWPPGYVPPYSVGENEIYGVQNPDSVFNVEMEQGSPDPPYLYQLEVWADNNWWVTTNLNVIGRYIWDNAEDADLGAVHYLHPPNPPSILLQKRTYSVSGMIVDNLNESVEGVRVEVDVSTQFPGHTVLADITDAEGYYTIYGLLPHATAYSVVPTKLGYTFSPVSRTVSISPAQPSDVTQQDFDASLPPPLITSASREDGEDGAEFGLPGRTNWGLSTQCTGIVVTGINFRDTPSLFLRGPFPSSDDTPCSNVAWVTSTKLTATVPAGMTPGDYAVRVINPDGQAYNWGSVGSPGFTIVPPPPPRVTGITPNPINKDYDGWLTVIGENFIIGCSLTIDGKTWTSLSPGGGTTLLVYYTPDTMQAGTWPVTVTNPGGQTSNDDVTLNVVGPPPPIVDSITPNSGPNNRITDVTIDGSGFLATPTVRIGTTACINVVFVNASRITAQVPTGITPGTYDVTVTNPDAQSGILPGGYTVTEPVLNVIGVSPPMGLSTTETDIIVVGENIKSSPAVPTVQIGATACTNVRVISSTCLLATVPSGITAGIYGLSLTNASGPPTVTLNNAYTVVGAPAVSTVVINSGGGDANNTTNIDVNGSGFVYIPTVEIVTAPNPTRCTDVQFVSAAKLNANVPSGLAAGTYDVRVTNPLGQVGTLAGGYTVNAAPPGEVVASSVAPAGGTNDTATDITITGSNFSAPALVSIMTSPSTPCTNVTVLSPTQITARVPSGLRVGSYDVEVGCGLSTGTKTHGFTVGGSGTLDADATLAGTVYLTGDVVVPTGKTLTIEPDALLIFDALSDDTSGGWDNERGEVRVYGRLNILGREEQRAAITSDGGDASDWLGIVFSDTAANCWIEYADITNSVYGLSFESSFSGVPDANNPRSWVRTINVASCATGVALNSSAGFSCPVIDTCSIDNASTGISAKNTSAPIFSTVLFRNVTDTGIEGKENAIVTLEGSSIVDASKAVSCPAAGTGEKTNASMLNVVFSVLGNGAVELSDSARLTARMVTHLLFPGVDITSGILSEKGANLAWDYSNIVQGNAEGTGVDWRSEGECAISATVLESWGVGLMRSSGCGEINLGTSPASGGNEFLGVKNPLATYNVRNDCDTDMAAQYNWWLSTDYSVIENYLYDQDDNPVLGNIDYSNFLSNPRSYSVSGRITDGAGMGVDRVHVVAYYSTPHTDNDRIAMTDDDGDYTIFGLVPGSYTIIAEREGYTFDPASHTVVITDTDINGQSYDGNVVPPTVYGIRRADGQQLPPYGNHWAYRPIGAEVIVTGINFRPGAAVALIGPLPGTDDYTLPVSSVSSTSIEANVPAGLELGGYAVRVTNLDNQFDTWGDDEANPAFTIVNPPPPIVYSVSPTTVNKDYNDYFTISGANFFDIPQVYFGDVMGYYNFEFPNWDPQPTSTTIWIRISLEDLTSMCDQGPQPVQVFNPDGQGSNHDVMLTVTGPPPPQVDSVVPGSGASNEVVTITINGAAFLETPDVTLVYSVTGDEVACLNETYVSSNQITAQVPTGLDIGLYTVRVCNPPCSPGAPQKCAELASAYEVLAPPLAVIGVSPPMGLSSAETDIIVVGESIQDLPALPTVQIGATACTNVRVISSTCLLATVPSGITPGLYGLTVDNADPQPPVTLANAYTVVGVPTIVSVSPNNGDANNTTPITVNGTGFVYIPAVRLEQLFDTGLSTGATSNTMTDASASWTVDELRDGIVRIVLGPGAGQERRIVSNTATVITVSRNWDVPPTASSYELTQEYHRCVEVKLDGATPTTKLTARVPSGLPSGDYYLSVINPLSQSGVSILPAFTVNAAPGGEPVVAGVSPSSGTNDGTTDIAITGSNFSAPALVSVMTSPSTPCTNVTVLGPTQITARVPAGLQVGSYDIEVGCGLATGTMTHGFTVGGSGTLSGNSTVSGIATLTGDVVVPDSATLTLEPGAMLVFEALSDDTSGGWDNERGEIRLYGRLNVLGDEANRVVMTSDGGASSDWLGVVFSDTKANGWIEYADITNAVYGLQFESSFAGPMTLTNPRPWVRDVNIAGCATGVGLNSSVAFTCPAIDRCTVDGVAKGITASGTAAPIFTATLCRNVSGTGFEGKERAILTMEGSSILDAPKAVSCPARAEGEETNASILNLVFSVLGNGSVELADSARLTGRMVTHLLFPGLTITPGLLGNGGSVLQWGYSNIVQGYADGVGVQWNSTGDCAINHTVVESWGVGVRRESGCGEMDLGDGVSTGWNEFLGVMNPQAAYNVSNGCPTDVSARSNWWLTTDTSVIDRFLYDQDDDPALGNIDYSSFLTGPWTYSVSGRITDLLGQGVDRVHVIARYSTPHTDNDRIALSDDNGDYTVFGLINGAYTIELEKQGYGFTPASITVTVNGSDINGQNYEASLAPPAVYGIRRSDGQVLAPYGNHWAYRPLSTDVVISGINFRPGATAALIGPLPGTGATNITVKTVTSTSIEATVPACFQQLGGYGVRVMNADGQSTTWGANELNPAFTIINPPPPIVYSISPATVDKDYDDVFIISGANFFEIPQVYFGDVMGYYNFGFPNYDPHPTSTTIWIRISLADLTSLCDHGPQAVQVFNGNCGVPQGSNTDVTLTVNGPPPPVLTSVSPVSGDNDAPVIITISGSSFDEGLAYSVYLVLVGTTTEIACDNVTFVSDQEITAEVPAEIPIGVYDIRVCNPLCSEGAQEICSVLPAAYTATWPPLALYRVAPSRGADDEINKIVLQGRSFEDVTEVRVNGVDCTDERFASSAVMTALIPASSLGAGIFDVAVSSDGWITSATLPNAYESVVNPTVGTVVPNTGDNNNTTTVAITGSNFAMLPTVGLQRRYDGGTVSSSTSTTLDDATKSWGANAFQNQFVEITGGTGEGQKRTIIANDANTLTVNPGWSVAPGAGSTYEIISTRYRCVDIGYTDTSNIAASVPSGIPAGTYRLMVTNPLNRTGILESAFTVNNPPAGEVTVSSITPVTGLNSIDPGGTDVTIRGTNFSTPALVSVMTSPSTPCTNITVVNPTQITARVPSDIPIGSYDIEVGCGLTTGTLTHGFGVGGAGTLPAGATTTISGTVIFTGDVIVPASSTLVVEEGSTVIFESMRDDTASGWDEVRGELNVYGVLLVNGNAVDRPQFQSTAGNPNEWLGIVSSDYTSTVMITHASIEHGVHGVHFSPAGAAIVEDCLIRDVSWGFFVDGLSAPEINRCTISETGGDAGEGGIPPAGIAALSWSSAPIVSDCTIVSMNPQEEPAPILHIGEGSNSVISSAALSSSFVEEWGDASAFILDSTVAHSEKAVEGLAEVIPGLPSRCRMLLYNSNIIGNEEASGNGITWLEQLGFLSMERSRIGGFVNNVLLTSSGEEGEGQNVDFGGGVRGSAGLNEFFGVLDPETAYNIKLENYGLDVYAENCWWLTPSYLVISRYILDIAENEELGFIDFAPPLLSRLTYSISGTVRDTQGSPIKDVRIESGYSCTVTDENGYYTLYGLPLGVNTVKLDSPFVTDIQKRDVTITDSDLTGVDFKSALYVPPTPPTPIPTATPTPVPPTPTPSPTPHHLFITWSPLEPKLLGPVNINVSVDPYPAVVDAWGVIYAANGKVFYMYGTPPCKISQTPRPISRNVNMSAGYSGTLLSVGSIPLGYEGTHRVVVGVIPPGGVPSTIPPYGFINQYWDQQLIKVLMP